jgi:hypothetical protein
MSPNSREIAELVKRIREAIREELNVSSRGLPFRVWDVAQVGAVLHMGLEPEGRHSIRDESLEEGRMAWEGDRTGSAEVISVLPSLPVVNACLTTGQPPREGSLVYVNPPRYLEALLALWEENTTSADIARWIFDLGENRIAWTHEVPWSVYSGLRPAQQRSFSLVQWKTSFLWGPARDRKDAYPWPAAGVVPRPSCRRSGFIALIHERRRGLGHSCR